MGERGNPIVGRMEFVEAIARILLDLLSNGAALPHRNRFFDPDNSAVNSIVAAPVNS